jgi:hypothetical protein
MSSADIEQHAYHNSIDAHGNAMTAGEYLMTRVGSDPITVDVAEDEVSGDLAFTIHVDGVETRQRVEECASDVTFTRL